jgi:hypothetical protein
MSSLQDGVSARKPGTPEPINSILKDFNFLPGIVDEADFEFSDQNPPVSEVVADVKDFEFSQETPINDGSNEILTSNPSSFDLNIAEFPMTHLSNRLPAGMSKTEIRYSDFINGKDGTKVQRSWMITSNAKIDIVDKTGIKIGEDIVGLGGPTALQVFFEILQIWKEQGFKSNMIFIGTYYSLLRRLNWPINGNSYKQLDRDLLSLYGLEFNAKNAYYDKTENRYIDRKMKLFEGWTLHKVNNSEQTASDYGYIHATAMFWDSMRNKTNFYLPFDKSYFKKLTPHEAKLSLYLSKIFNPYRNRVVKKYRRNIFALCDILPIIATERRRQKFLLLKAVEGLIQKDFNLLAEYYVEGEVIVFINKQTISRINELKGNRSLKSKEQIEMLVQDQLNICGDIHSRKFYEIVAKYVPDEIIFKCLAEAKSEGKNTRKYYVFQIRIQAKEYLKDYIFNDKEEAMQVSLKI